ncbi:MAG: nucleotide exchange factor GrpE [Betaproteobacteria bacterium]|nr:nucleotide exchange factor GrpE [Betaproteobacteria bacterium]
MDQNSAAGMQQTESDNTDSVPGLEHQLREAELKASEHYDAWLRAKAETENVRRRAAEDVIKASKFAIEKFTAELLPVKDSLEQTLSVEAPTLESIREGVELTLRNLVRAFEKGHVNEIDPVGEKFDPNHHQAMSMVPSEQAANTVVQVFQKGYLLEGRVIRPALVAVSSGSGS